MEEMCLNGIFSGRLKRLRRASGIVMCWFEVSYNLGDFHWIFRRF